MPTPAPIRAVLFDLDGTLLDTLDAIAASANHALKEAGVARQLSAQEWRVRIGGGGRKLFAEFMPEAHIDAAIAAYQKHHQGPGAELIRVFPGMDTLPAQLAARGIGTAVLSNKPHESTVAIIARFFPGNRFARVQGVMAGVAPKPDPAAALAMLAAMGVAPAEALYIGDSEMDVQVARRAGMQLLACAFGMRPRAELAQCGAGWIVDQPAQVAVELLERLGH